MKVFVYLFSNGSCLELCGRFFDWVGIITSNATDKWLLGGTLGNFFFKKKLGNKHSDVDPVAVSKVCKQDFK